ncbi:MAG: DUF115 domain-containing protein [Methanocellales archaeon]|nr:DUF115 domain-containing protein [Methanocellales archaeon]
MNFADWEPIYQEILKDFGFDRSRDEHSAEILSESLKERSLSTQRLHKLLHQKSIIVCGNASSLKEELESVDVSNRMIIAADGATSVLLEHAILPDIVVTDLDGDMDDIISADRLGSVIVVHAHGDNIPAIKRYVPLLNHVIGSAQSTPLKNIYNFGGFTDGDRCVFMAHHFDAESVTLLGFDFEDAGVSPIKKKKLQWARRLIKMCEF